MSYDLSDLRLAVRIMRLFPRLTIATTNYTDKENYEKNGATQNSALQ